MKDRLSLQGKASTGRDGQDERALQVKEAGAGDDTAWDPKDAAQ